MIAHIATATPVEIDTELAEILSRKARVEYTIDRAAASLIRANASAAASPTISYDEYIASIEAQLVELRTELDAVVAEAAPLHDEWVRRGRWTRAYLVSNSNGHVHSSTSCASCYSTTRFYWVTDMSGHPEAEIVDAAGDSACTICYPSAPVALDPTYRKASTIEEPTARAARIEREEAKAAREAKRAETGIANVDGSPLRGHWGILKTARAAQIELVGNIADHRAYGYSLDSAANDRIVAALCHKRAMTVEELMSEVEAKVAAKIKRDAR